MSELDKFKELWSDMDPQLVAWRTEADELREAVTPASEHASLDTLHGNLVEYRRVQDRLEAIVANVGLARSRMRKLVADLENEYDDAWRAAMDATRVGEYSSAQERNAMYKTKSIQELVNLRRGKRMQADVDEVYDYVQIKHKGVDSSRRDIDSRIRMISLAAQLER